MSSTTNTETENKEQSTEPTPTNPTPKTSKKKKKKKPYILYQQTAVKYFDGFMKNKRYNKGINLSTACAIFKTAWELPENNGLILPSRVQRHFKQVLPKKPKQSKNKKTKKAKTSANEPKPTVTDTNEQKTDSLRRSRTVVQLNVNSLNLNPANTASNLTMNIPSNNSTAMRRSMLPMISPNIKKESFKQKQAFEDKIESAIEDKIESAMDDSEQTQTAHIVSQSMGNLMYGINADPIRAKNTKLSSLLRDSDTPITPDVMTPNIYNDHADLTMDDMRPDVEETPMLAMRAETDIKHMHNDLVSFEVDIKQERQEIIVVKEEKSNVSPKKPKKKKKKTQILYAEDATKLFKKISDGKRFKNGITLKKACNIFSIAWELSEENGRILPSKVARHFKHVLPSKKSKNIPKKKKTQNRNIKPSNVAKSRVTVSVSESKESETENGLSKPQTMRGHTYNRTVQTKKWNLSIGNGNNNALNNGKMRRSANQMQLPKHLSGVKPKKSIISDLESLIANDPNRSNSNDNEKVQIRRKKAGSMTDLDLRNIKKFEIESEDHIVENEIEEMIREKKKMKKKENDAIKAIDSAFGF